MCGFRNEKCDYTLWIIAGCLILSLLVVIFVAFIIYRVMENRSLAKISWRIFRDDMRVLNDDEMKSMLSIGSASTKLSNMTRFNKHHAIIGTRLYIKKNWVGFFESRFGFFESRFGIFETRFGFSKVGLEFSKLGFEFSKLGLEFSKLGLEFSKLGLEFSPSVDQPLMDGPNVFKALTPMPHSTSTRSAVP